MPRVSAGPPPLLPCPVPAHPDFWEDSPPPRRQAPVPSPPGLAPPFRFLSGQPPPPPFPAGAFPLCGSFTPNGCLFVVGYWRPRPQSLGPLQVVVKKVDRSTLLDWEPYRLDGQAIRMCPTKSGEYLKFHLPGIGQRTFHRQLYLDYYALHDSPSAADHDVDHWRFQPEAGWKLDNRLGNLSWLAVGEHRDKTQFERARRRWLEAGQARSRWLQEADGRLTICCRSRGPGPRHSPGDPKIRSGGRPNSTPGFDNEVTTSSKKAKKTRNH